MIAIVEKHQQFFGLLGIAIISAFLGWCAFVIATSPHDDTTEPMPDAIAGYWFENDYP